MTITSLVLDRSDEFDNQSFCFILDIYTVMIDVASSCDIGIYDISMFLPINEIKLNYIPESPAPVYTFG